MPSLPGRRDFIRSATATAAAVLAVQAKWNVEQGSGEWKALPATAGAKTQTSKTRRK